MYDGPETMAAAGWLQEAGSKLDFSFTRALIEFMPFTLATRIEKSNDDCEVKCLWYPVHCIRKATVPISH